MYRIDTDTAFIRKLKQEFIELKFLRKFVEANMISTFRLTSDFSKLLGNSDYQCVV